MQIHLRTSPYGVPGSIARMHQQYTARPGRLGGPAPPKTGTRIQTASHGDERFIYIYLGFSLVNIAESIWKKLYCFQVATFTLILCHRLQTNFRKSSVLASISRISNSTFSSVLSLSPTHPYHLQPFFLLHSPSSFLSSSSFFPFRVSLCIPDLTLIILPHLLKC